MKMIQHTKISFAASSLLWFGLTLAVVDSLSSVNPVSRTCPSSRATSHLFSGSDFSSHPYSIYYGTSGSTAKQNFGQNDDINDVYGYGPDSRGREEPYENPHDRRLQSMQDIPLLHDRRGAAVFSTKYKEGRQNYHDYVDRERAFHAETYMDDQYSMMNQMDCLLDERDHLRRKLDHVVNENIHLQQNQYNVNGTPEPRPEQNQYRQEISSMPQNQATTSAVNSVMEELKNMQRNVQALEAQRQGRTTEEIGEFMNSSDSEIPTVESLRSELKNMEQKLKELDSEQPQSYESVQNGNGYDTSTSEASQQGLSGVEDFNPNPTVEKGAQESKDESTASAHDFEKLKDASKIFDGQYEVVIKAELKKKIDFEGTPNPVEEQNDINEKSKEDDRAETFGSKYL